MNLFYEAAVYEVGNVFILLTLLFLLVAAHGWAISRLLVYAGIKEPTRLWWGVFGSVLLSMIGLALRFMVIFTDRLPPLRVVDLLEYGSLTGIVLAIAWYVQAQILKAHTHKRRFSDDLNHA